MPRFTVRPRFSLTALPWTAVLTFAAVAFCGTIAGAEPPRIAALFPAGAKAGETVEVSVRGGNLNGATGLIVTGTSGVTATLVGGNGKVDETAKPLFDKQCTGCHEARSPANRSLTPDQWAATVDRMIQVRGAAINKADRDGIVGYLQSAARAGQVMARVQVEPNAAPGVREIRIVTPSGTSSSYSFEVGSLPEVVASRPNAKMSEAQKINVPSLINGVVAQSGQRDYFAFEAKKGQRFAFNLKSFRLSEKTQEYFNPALYLYDGTGREIGKNLGYFGLDPLIDWTAPADGTYTVLVRDLLWRGSPSSVYRLSVGAVPYDAVLAPETAAQPGKSVGVRMLASLDAGQAPVTVAIPDGMDGVVPVSTPVGDVPLLVRDLPDGGTAKGATAPAVALPAVFRGQITQIKQTDVFHVTARRAGSTLDMFAKRIGSPLRVKVVIKNAQGGVINQREAEPNADLQIGNAFPAPGDYTVEISDADGKTMPQGAYQWEALDGRAEFSLTAFPDVLNLQPGGSLPLVVRVTRRDNLTGPIKVTLPNLPAGVTATSEVIPPDDDKAVVVVTAAPTATVQNLVVTVNGEAPGQDGAIVTRRARPVEDYRVNNQSRLINRSSQVVGVVGEAAPFTLAWGDDLSKLVLKVDEMKEIKVKVNRRADFKKDIYVYFTQLPPGMYIESTLYIPADKNEGIMKMHANGGAQFLRNNRPLPNLPPMTISAVGIVGGGDGSVSTCTPALPVVGPPVP